MRTRDNREPQPFVEEQHRDKNGQLIRSTVRDLSASERLNVTRARNRMLRLIKIRDAAEKQIRETREKCTHFASFDVYGYVYDERYCYVCGTSRGSV